MEIDSVQAFKEACFPIMLIWERIIHAYTSDSPPTDWGLQKGDSGFQSWFFTSQNERYTVVWDNKHSYWKVNSPFDANLFFVGPPFIDKSRKGLHIPPLFTVINSDTDLLIPHNSNKVATKMLHIVRSVCKPCMPMDTDPSKLLD